MTENINMFDAHCHPTDSPASLNTIPRMKTKQLVCMSTNSRDLEKVAQLATEYPDRVVPAFGYHPWFSHWIYDDTADTFSAQLFSKTTHYKSTITPEPAHDFIDKLPEPLPLSKVLNTIEYYLEKFPNALVGECGLDKAFRIPDPATINHDTDDMSEAQANRILSIYKVTMDHQNLIFSKQMELAIKYNRPVSIHAVQCPAPIHDIVMAGFKSPSCDEKSWPPAICLHSYTGSPDFLKSTWYKPISKKKQKALTQNGSNFKLPHVYVSLSFLLNQKDLDALLPLIPSDSLLFESDYHSAGEFMDELNTKVLDKASKCLGKSALDLSKEVESNFLTFTQSYL